ncbi:MAG: methyltransferase [Pseudomonadota bacterium]
MSGNDWRDWRTRLIANPRFRQRVARIWPFSLVARRQARRLFDISAGFVYSQTLMACVELNWFDRLADGPLERAVLATGSGLETPALDRLIDAAIALDLLEARKGARVALGPLGAALIGDKGITSMAAHHHLLYQDLADPLALLRGEAPTTQLGDYWGYAKQDPGSLATERVAAYSKLMAESQPMVSEQVLAAYDFSSARRLLDVGGGTGAFVGAVGNAYPGLQLEVFDLPGVAGLRSDSGQRAVTRHAGNFCQDALPSGADLISLVRIIHDHDDDVVDQLLTNIRQKLPVDGTLLIAEPLAGTPGAETVGDVYFGFYLLAMGSGKARTINQINELLIRNGFSEARFHPTPVPLIASVLSTNPV